MKCFLSCKQKGRKPNAAQKVRKKYQQQHKSKQRLKKERPKNGRVHKRSRKEIMTKIKQRNKKKNANIAAAALDKATRKALEVMNLFVYPHVVSSTCFFSVYMSPFYLHRFILTILSIK